MTRVKLNTSVVGNTLKDGKFAGHFSYAKGDEMELPDNEAQNYIAKGMAQAVQSKKQ